MANPTGKVPGGEPYQHFLDRCVPFLREIVESDELIVAVTHARVITMLKALCVNGGGEPDMATLKRRCPIEPSGIMVVSRGWKVAFQTEVEPESMMGAS
jgi:broad specificity phosphatase PhoE